MELFLAIACLVLLFVVLPIFTIVMMGRMAIKKVTGQSVNDLIRVGQFSAARMVEESKQR